MMQTSITEHQQLQQRLSAVVASEVDEDSQKILSFLLDDEIFGIGILTIKEIIEFMNVAKVPMVPPYIRGVINLRGNVVPIIDLAERLGKRSVAVSRRTCIVIIEMTVDGEMQDIGIMVDSVNEVIDLANKNIEDAPAFGASIPAEYIRGMGNINNEFMVLLDLATVLDVEDLSNFELDVNPANNRALRTKGD